MRIKFSLRMFLILSLVIGAAVGIIISSRAGVVVSLNSNNFDEVVDGSFGPVLVVFTAEWCGPCQAMKPDLDKLAQEHRWSATVGVIDIDDDPALARRFKVNAIPRLMVFRGGKATEDALGGKPFDEMEHLMFED